MQNEIHFLPLKIERGKARVCSCTGATIEVDTENRIVLCTKCGAVLDPFESLLKFASEFENYVKQREKIRQSVELFKEEAEYQRRRASHFRGVANISTNYKNGLYPHCPKCSALFHPGEITHFSNKRFYTDSDESEVEK